MKVDKIYSRYYDSSLGKWFVTVRVRMGVLYRYMTVSRDTEEEAYGLKEGDEVNG